MNIRIQQIKLILTYLLKIIGLISPRLRKWIDKKIIEIKDRIKNLERYI